MQHLTFGVRSVAEDSSGERLREERAETVRRFASLKTELNGIIESALLWNNDDEHDPYGRCDHCGCAIGEERLDAIPTATRCSACASLLPDR